MICTGLKRYFKFPAVASQSVGVFGLLVSLTALNTTVLYLATASIKLTRPIQSSWIVTAYLLTYIGNQPHSSFFALSD